MKITMVTHSMYPESIGGREKYVYYLANSLGKRGHEVRVFSCAQSGRSRTSHHKNFTTFYFPSVDIPLKTAKYRIPIMLLLKLLQDDSDVIHAHDLHHFTTFVSALSARIKKKRLVVTEHGYPPSEGLMKLLIKIYDKTLLGMIKKSAEKFIGVSDFISEEMASRYGVEKKKIMTVRTGIYRGNHFENKNLKFAERYGLENKKIILGIGRLTKEKGFQYLIKAFNGISKTFPDTALVIIGPQTSYKTALQRLSRNLGLNRRIIFTGPLDDSQVKGAISSCEVMVIPSEYEPFPLAALEALENGKAVIASTAGGLPEIFTHNFNGLLVRPGDAEDLEEKLGELLSNKKLKASLMKNARKSSKRFSWDKFIEKMERIYEETSAS